MSISRFIQLMLAICLLFFIHPSYSQTMTQPFTAEWEKIDSLAEKRLPRSALREVNQLLEKARKQDLPAQVVKCIMYREQFQVQLEEEGQVKAITRLEEEIATAGFPERPVLQSLLAEMYDNYLMMNSYDLGSQSEVSGPPSGDLPTWSIGQIIDRSTQLHMASLTDERIKDIPIDRFDPILTEGRQVKGLRPTLYDFLAHRAIDYFLDERTFLPQPIHAFQLDDPRLFAPAAVFTEIDFEARDTASAEYKALGLFQDLLRFHRENPEARVDVDLKRLDFMRRRSGLPDREDLYLQALNELAERFAGQAVSAEIAYARADYIRNSGSDWQPGSEEEGRWALKQAADICRECRANFVESYGAKKCASLIAQLERKELAVSTEEVLVPERPILTNITYRNLSKTWLRLVNLSEAESERLNRMNTEEALEFLGKQKVLKQRRLQLPLPIDYRSHSVEIALDPLPAGHYALMIADNSGFKTRKAATGWMKFTVSRIGFFQRSGSGSQLEFLVVNREKGFPLQGVNAELYTGYYDSRARKMVHEKTAEVRSDEEGRILFPPVDDRFNYRVTFIWGRDRLTFDGGYYYGRNRDGASSPRPTTRFFLDRAIYRPGQTVYFKGVAMEKDENGLPKILPNEEVKITFYDVNRQEIAAQTFVTNDYGTFNGSFAAPASGLTGSMHLQSSLGDSRHYFSVEEYKRPTFELEWQPQDGTPALGETVEVAGKALAYAGYPVTDADVTYTVTREIRFPWIPWWQRSFLPVSESAILTTGQTRTDEGGIFKLSFPARIDPSIDEDQHPVYVFRIEAEVTDISGETRTTTRHMRLSGIGLTAELAIPDQLDRSRSTGIAVKTQNLNGEEVAATGKLKIFSLRSPQNVLVERYWNKPDQFLLSEKEFKELFPHYPYRNEDQPHEWEAKQLHFEGGFDTGKSGQIEIDPAGWPVGEYRADLMVLLAGGDTLTRPFFFSVYDSQNREIPEGIMFRDLSPEKNYRAGETMEQILAGTEGLHLYYELEREGEVLAGDW
ncbi:MAG: MG2 domain-containing protein, partial [Saprospiraceae bacterium]|nr:MG2 domain-containing protein [Saprospiraceae bacterium]